MKAFFARSYGGPEVMQLGELPEPSPRSGQVLVDVKASSINPVDWKVRNGDAKVVSGWKFPKVYGTDVAGVVAAMGEGVTGFAVGDAVYGYTAVMFGKPGAHAERVCVSGKNLRRKPEAMSFEQAAALPVAGLTALHGLRQCGDLSGKAVLINGATGGVGHMALQIAKARGAIVTAVTSEQNLDRARELGANDTIDYKQTDFTQGTARYDVIFDAHGHLTFSRAERALEARGIYVTTLGNPKLILQAIRQKFSGGKQIVFANLRARTADFAELERLVTGGDVRVVIENKYDLEHAADAFARSEGGGVVGKVVLQV